MVPLQSQDLDHLWIIKIGGSIISTEDGSHHPGGKTLNLIAGYLKRLKNPYIVVHGTGYISKEYARNNQILDGKIETHRRETATECLLMLKEIHLAVLTALVRKGIHALSISPFTFCELRNNQIEFRHIDLLLTILSRGFVPVLHGDLILDQNSDFLVCSSDALVAVLAKQFPADKLLFATDVQGVYQQDPKQFPHSERFDILSTQTLNILAQMPNDRNDVSGAMPAKLKIIQQITDYFRECYIFEGRSHDSWKALVQLNRSTGTLIQGNRRMKQE